MHTARIRFAAAAAAACAVVSIQAQQRPAYKAEVAVVPVDTVVIDAEGRPVPGLAPEDFVVTVDGRPRKVLTAQFLSSAAAPRPGRTAGQTAKAGWDVDAAFESVYVGNQAAASIEKRPSRTVMIAIDQSGFSMETGRNAAMAARGLLDLLHPNDRVGLVVFPPPGPNIRPTWDHARVREALGHVGGAAEPYPSTDISLSISDALTYSAGDSISRSQVLERSCALMPQPQVMGGMSVFDQCRQVLEGAVGEILQYARRQTLISLQGLGAVVRAAGSDGSPSAIVVVSSGLYAGGRARQLDLDDDVREFGRLAAASRATVYGLYVESGFLDRDSMDKRRVTAFSTSDGDMRLEGLRQLSSLAGGTVTRVAAGSEEGFRKVSLELSAYYLLGLEGVPGDRDGRRHGLSVRVNRPGVTVRAREELYLPAERKLTGEEAVRDALSRPELERELPIRLATQMMREPGSDKVRVVISAAIDQGVKTASSVRVGYLIRGAGAEATAAISEVGNRELPVFGKGADASLSYVDAAQLNPGRYLLRLAAMDERGRLGSVQQVIDATLVGGERATFSDLLLLDPLRRTGETLTPVPDGRVTGPEVEALLEIYPGGGPAPSTVAFDIADAPAAPPIATGSVEVEKREDDRLVAGVNMTLRDLPPGVYVMNARVLDGEREVGRISRPFLLERPMGAGELAPRVTLAFAASGGLLREFSPEDVLGPDALGYFLNRMQASESAATGGEVLEAASSLRGGRFDEVLSALPRQSDTLSVAFLKGLALLGKGELQPAAEQFRAALRISNDFLPAAFYLGSCYAAGHKDREAVGAWQTSLVSETDSRIIYEVLADALLRLNDGRQAEAIASEAMQRWPDDDVFVPRMAAARVLLKKQREALAALEPYIAAHPGESEPLFLAIRLLYEAHEAGKPLKGKAEDRVLAEKYGALYRDSTGSNQPLVARWVAAIAK